MIRKITSRITNTIPDIGFTKLSLDYKFKKLKERRFGRFQKNIDINRNNSPAPPTVPTNTGEKSVKLAS